MTPNEAKAAGWRKMSIASGFTDLLDVFWSRQDGDAWRYAALPGAQHLNNRNIVHGGLLLSFADHALGLTLWERSGRKGCVTAQLNMQFVAAAFQGDLLELNTEIVRMGRSLVVVRGTIWTGGRTIAIADGIWKIVGCERAQDVSDGGAAQT